MSVFESSVHIGYREGGRNMAGQMENDKNKYAHLDQLSTEALEELLRVDIESPNDDNDEAVIHILEVIEQREKEHPTGRLTEVDKAWEEFQLYYNIPEGKGLSLYTTGDKESPPTGNCREVVTAEQTQKPSVVRPRRLLKNSMIAAATIAALMVGMVGVQAAGIDVFGTIGRWTDETFHFVSSNGAIQNGTDVELDSRNMGYYDLVQTALDRCGIAEKLAPTWYPEGFEASEPEIIETSKCDVIHINFSGVDENFFNIDITRYQSPSDLTAHLFEKDSISIEQYTSGAKTFYILSNMDTITATYSEGFLVEQISGSLSMEEIKAIIDSIGV